LSTALRKLSKSSTQGPPAVVKTELADEKACVQPVVSVSKNDEEGDIALTGSTTTVQHENSVVPVCDTSTPETAASLARDIQIHVQRPSPVREVSGSHRKLFSVGAGLDSKDDEKDVWVDNMAMKNATASSAKESALAEDSSTMSANKDELAASSLENVSSNVVAKVEEVDMQRVRPVSGPATVTCAERPEFDLVRKSRSVTNSLDEEGEHVEFAIHSRRSIGAICSATQDSSVRQFGSGMGFSAAKDSIRRIYSTVSFNRHSLKSPGSSFDIDDPVDLSSHSVSVQPGAQKANSYGFRSRHTSGLETPMSALDTSSVTSTGEAGTVLSVEQ